MYIILYMICIYFYNDVYIYVICMYIILYMICIYFYMCVYSFRAKETVPLRRASTSEATWVSTEAFFCRSVKRPLRFYIHKQLSLMYVNVISYKVI